MSGYVRMSASDMIRLKITQHIPEFQTDEGPMGPFEPGDVVEIPEPQARIILERGYAQLEGGGQSEN